MELATIYIFFAGLLGIFAGAIKIQENLKLKKENLILKRKLGKIDDSPTKKKFIL